MSLERDMPSADGHPSPSVRRTETIAPEPVESLAAVLGIEVPHSAGDVVPPLWHWLHLLERSPQAELGEDGHPVVGLPAPPGPGRRRMFGGGRVTTHRLLTIGAPATRVSTIVSSVDKHGRTGMLTLTTVRHDIIQDGELAIREEQDIVYRAPDAGSLPVPPVEATPRTQPAAQAAAGPLLRLAVDERLLFRFSALTYNAHRIHYDLEWCRREGYDDVVIHGPLLALMMGEHMRRSGIGLVGRTFAYRLVSPMTGPQVVTIAPSAAGLERGAQALSAAHAVCAISTLSEN